MLEFIAKKGDFTEFDNDSHLTLTRIDRNNTHYYTDSRCPKCGGTGHIFGYEHVQGGICFLCGGSGTHPQKITVRTEEYAKKLADKRFENSCKKAIELNKSFLKKEGFSNDGKVYIVLGDTYSIKDRLKAYGAFFNYQLGWHFNKPTDLFPVHELSVDTVIGEDEGEPIHLLNKTQFGGYMYHEFYESTVKSFIRGIQDEHLASILPETHWFGNIGERVTLVDMECSLLAHWDSFYGTTMLYKFVSPDGTAFTWKTGSYVETEFVGTGKKITVVGTIKDHSEYKGQKQTELTRCKIS